MKRIFIVILIGLFSLPVFAQIEMFDENAKKVSEPISLPYDSLRNISKQKYGSGDSYKLTLHHLIGQTIMYCGDPYFSYESHLPFLPPTPFVKGDYYRVEGILPDEDGVCDRISLTDIKTGTHLEEGNRFSVDNYNYKWVVVGHYEKMKSLYLNKEYVYLGTDDVSVPYSSEKANGLINLETDTVTKEIPKLSVWNCVGVQVKPRNKEDGMMIDKRSPIVLIFDNPTYGKHYCYLENEDGCPYKPLFDETLPYVCGRFQLKSYYDNKMALIAANKERRKAELIKEYGAENANLIIEGRVRIGMTKNMCVEAWGYPYDKNISIGSWGSHEQWVYGNSYLYFEGNKLTAIQY